MWSEEDLAFAAGFLDGEGCLTTFKRGNHFKIVITCSNTNKTVIEWFKDTFGGSISATPGRKENHRTMYSWSLVSGDASKLLSEIVTYLRVKKDQAIGLMLIQATVTKGGGRIPQYMVEERQRLANTVKELKHESY